AIRSLCTNTSPILCGPVSRIPAAIVNLAASIERTPRTPELFWYRVECSTRISPYENIDENFHCCDRGDGCTAVYPHSERRSEPHREVLQHDGDHDGRHRLFRYCIQHAQGAAQGRIPVGSSIRDDRGPRAGIHVGVGTANDFPCSRVLVRHVRRYAYLGSS